MQTKIRFTRDDIDNLALKLDEFATILNEREHTLLATLFYMACASRGDIPSREDGEPLSAAFLVACNAATRSNAKDSNTKGRSG